MFSFKAVVLRTLALALVATTLTTGDAVAQVCTYCDWGGSGCGIIFGPGWYSCHNIFDGCIVSGSGCGGPAMRKNLDYDGTFRFVERNAVDSSVSVQQRATHALMQKRPIGSLQRSYQRACRGWIVARSYSADLGLQMRDSAQVIDI